MCLYIVNNASDYFESRRKQHLTYFKLGTTTGTTLTEQLLHLKKSQILHQGCFGLFLEHSTHFGLSSIVDWTRQGFRSWHPRFWRSINIINDRLSHNCANDILIDKHSLNVSWIVVSFLVYLAYITTGYKRCLLAVYYTRVIFNIRLLNEDVSTHKTICYFETHHEKWKTVQHTNRFDTK